MDVLGGDEGSEISCVLGDDDKVIGEAACQYKVVGFSASPEIQRMHGEMLAGGV